jgi:hypothetical protein
VGGAYFEKVWFSGPANDMRLQAISMFYMDSKALLRPPSPDFFSGTMKIDFTSIPGMKSRAMGNKTTGLDAKLFWSA